MPTQRIDSGAHDRGDSSGGDAPRMLVNDIENCTLFGAKFERFHKKVRNRIGDSHNIHLQASHFFIWVISEIIVVEKS